MKSPPIPVWKTVPILRILIAFIPGILFQEYWPISFNGILGGIGLSFFGWGLLLLKNTGWHYRHPYFKGIALHFCMFFSGALLLNHQQLKLQPSWFGHYQSDSSMLLIQLEEPLSVKTNSFGGKASVLSRYTSKHWQNCKGKLLLYFKKDSAILQLQYGSRLIIKKKPDLIRASGNPGSFDFATYCGRQQCFHQVYLTANDFTLLPEKGGNFFFRQLYKFRAHMLDLLRAFIKGKEEIGLAEALVIGFKDDLNKELVQSYSATGTVHVIAISGLHLGLIYWLLEILFGLLSIPKNLRWIKAILIMAGLWGFAFLAGGGPSVLRSALMFSCMLLSKQWLRHANAFNSLGVACFFLVVYNPYWLWDTGFQLSFAAVASILCYQQPICDLIEPNNKWLEKLWSSAGVTLAAQVLTLPFCLYYFHQFPVYFLLTNLIAVPLSSAILLACLLLLVLGPVPVLAEHWGTLVNGGLKCMNLFIRLMEGLPFGAWKPLQLDLIQSMILMSFIVFLSLALKTRKNYYWGFAQGGLILLLSLRFISFRQADVQRKLVIYQIKGNSLLEYVEGRGSTQWAIEGKIPFPGKANDPSYAASLAFRSNSFKRDWIYKGPLLSVPLKNKSMLILNGDMRKHKLKINITADWLLVAGKSRCHPEKLLEQMKIGLVILDGSNSLYSVNKWKKACQSLRIPFYSTELQGAFVMPLE